MRISGLVAGCERRRREPREWRHNDSDVTMIISGLVAGGTGRKYDDWRHVATGCNAVVNNEHPQNMSTAIYYRTGDQQDNLR